jgi:transcriptional regulator with XRE-family HTH domain
MDLALTRKEVARRLGTNPQSVKHWEEHMKSYVRPMHLLNIIEFLGYTPLPKANTAGEAGRRARLARGWSMRRLAQESGVDAATINRIEADRLRLGQRSRRAVNACLDLQSDIESSRPDGPTVFFRSSERPGTDRAALVLRNDESECTIGAEE